MKKSSLKFKIFRNFILIILSGSLTCISCEKKEGCDATEVDSHIVRLSFSISTLDQNGNPVKDYPVSFGVSKTWCDGTANQESILESGKTDANGFFFNSYDQWGIEFNNSKDFWTVYFHAGPNDEINFLRDFTYDDLKNKENQFAFYPFVIYQ